MLEAQNTIVSIINPPVLTCSRKGIGSELDTAARYSTQQVLRPIHRLPIHLLLVVNHSFFNGHA